MTLIFIIECICIKYFNYFCYYCCSSTQCMTNQKLIFLLLTKSYCPTMDDCWILVASSRMRGTFCRSARQHTVSLRRRPAIQAVWMMSYTVPTIQHNSLTVPMASNNTSRVSPVNSCEVLESPLRVYSTFLSVKVPPERPLLPVRSSFGASLSGIASCASSRSAFNDGCLLFSSM